MALLKSNLFNNPKYNTENKILSYLIILFLFLNFILFGIDGLNKALDPQEFDTTGYLGEALVIQYHGGISNFVQICLNGTYKQANQHPLYILLITPFASTNISFFITAKIVSFVFGLLSLLILFLIANKMFGNLIAALSVFAMTLNSVFIEQSTIVASESLLVLFSISTMYFIIEGFKDNKLWTLAGICAGFAFLAKGSGLFLLPGFVVAVFVIYKFKFVKNKFFWSFWIFFLLVSSPLLLRNIIVYQNPLFNVNNYIGMYGKDVVESSTYYVFNPKVGASHWYFDFNESLTKKPEPSASFDIKNSVQKIITESRVFLDTLYGAEKRLSTTRRIIPFVFLLFLFVGVFREKNKGSKSYILSTLIFFLIALSFLRPLPRYLLPILPFLWIYIWFGVFTILEILRSYLKNNFHFDINKYIPYTILTILLLSSGYAYAKKDINNPLNSVEYSNERLSILNWLNDNLKENDLYSFGPNFNWQLNRGTWIVPPDSARVDFSKSIEFLKKYKINYIILEKRHIESWKTGSQVTKLADKFFNIDSAGISQKIIVDNWELVYSDQQPPKEFLIFKQNINEVGINKEAVK